MRRHPCLWRLDQFIFNVMLGTLCLYCRPVSTEYSCPWHWLLLLLQTGTVILVSCIAVFLGVHPTEKTLQLCPTTCGARNIKKHRYRAVNIQPSSSIHLNANGFWRVEKLVSGEDVWHAVSRWSRLIWLQILQSSTEVSNHCGNKVQMLQ